MRKRLDGNMSRRLKIFDLHINIRSHISPDAYDVSFINTDEHSNWRYKIYYSCTDPLSLAISVNNAYFRVFRWFADAKRTITAEEVTTEIVHLKRK